MISFRRLSRRALAVVGCLIGCGACTLAAAAPPTAFKAPYLPTDDREVLQEVPSTADPAVVQMRSLRVAHEADPDALQPALGLAGAYVDYSRQIGDAHYAGYAEAVIAPWMALASPPAAVLDLQATILQYRHEFAAARVLLHRVFSVDPANAQAWLTLATLDMVQGDYPAAARDCAQVTNTAGVEFGLACTGNLRSYVGRARQSLALLEQVEAAGHGLPAATASWVQGLLAETAERLGDSALAERHYLAALQLTPRDNFLLVAYADYLLDRGRPREVLDLLRGHEQSDTAFLRIALAHAALGSPEAQRDTWIMAARFEALKLRGSDYFGREESRFALELEHDPEGALEMATQNWQLQRAPWDARVLLEAALAAGQPRAAQAVLQFVQQTHLEDPVVASLVARLRGQGSGATPPHAPPRPAGPVPGARP